MLTNYLGLHFELVTWLPADHVYEPMNESEWLPQNGLLAVTRKLAAANHCFHKLISLPTMGFDAT